MKKKTGCVKKLGCENVFYTPQFSNYATISFRRLSWYWNIPMTEIINIITKKLPEIANAEQVCQACKIKDKCAYCAFNKPELTQDEQTEELISL